MNEDRRPFVLVVDDDMNTREAVETLLTLDGYHVATAIDGLDALELLRSGAHPDLILLDVTMPRMDGLEFRKAQLRDPALAAIPVVVCSGQQELPDNPEELGNVTILRKPISVDHLLTVLQQHCRLPDNHSR
jgi:CheY-like chemotaxis protein